MFDLTPPAGLRALATAALCIWAVAAPASDATARAPVPCSELSRLSDLEKDGDLYRYTNAGTGDSLNYAVIGDGAVSDELIVLFPGTSSILPDWPLQMLTNATYSPDIVSNDDYRTLQDGNISLCHDYYILLFDYPGVGKTAYSGSLTGDRIVEDVDGLIDEVASLYPAVSGDTVSVVGWSLGTLYALKYALLMPAARTDRTVQDIVLIATKAGGKFAGVTAGHQASCVTTMLRNLKKTDLSDTFRARLKAYFSKLTFPYAGQAPYSRLASGCRARVSATKETVTLNVDPDCGRHSACKDTIDLQTDNRATAPWDRTEGVDQALYLQERYFVNDWNLCHCVRAGAGYESKDCYCASRSDIEMSERNGGVCRTYARKAWHPVSFRCAELDYDGTLAVINADRDLVIQWTYGRALYKAYARKYGTAKTAYYKYTRGRSAGHAVMFQRARWTQRKIHKTLAGSP